MNGGAEGSTGRSPERIPSNPDPEGQNPEKATTIGGGTDLERLPFTAPQANLKLT